MSDITGVIMNEGLSGNAFTRPIASSNVPLALGLAGLSKPMWLSLICRKVKPFCFAATASSMIPSEVVYTAGNSPKHASARPGHAFEYLTAVQAVIAVCHRRVIRNWLTFTGTNWTERRFIPARHEHRRNSAQLATSAEWRTRLSGFTVTQSAALFSLQPAKRRVNIYS